MINYGRQAIDDQDIAAVIKVLQSDWLTTGPVLNLFEETLAQCVQAKHAIACNNGTSALHLALLAIGIEAGDYVLVSAITFVASANVVRYLGAEVIFVDVDPQSGLMTPETLQQTLVQCAGKRIKALINVHFAGQCTSLSALYQIAKSYDLWIIEDAAHAIGTDYIDQDDQRYPIGANAFSDLTTFSFHPVKNITMGEGGAVTTCSHNLAQRIRYFRNHGLRSASGQMLDTQGVAREMHDLGFNYRVSDLNCALGLSQLQKLKNFKAQRHALVQYYDQILHDSPSLTPLKKSVHADPLWHLYIVQIDFTKLGKTRAMVMQQLASQGIQTQVHYLPLYQHPYYQQRYGQISLAGATAYYTHCLTLPLFVGLQPIQQQHIVDILVAVLKSS